MARKKRGRATVIEGTVYRAAWDEEWDVEPLSIVTDDQREFFLLPEGAGRRLAELLGELVCVEGILDNDSDRGNVVRVRSFEVLTHSSHSSADDEDDGIEDEGKIHSMGFKTVRSRQPSK